MGRTKIMKINNENIVYPGQGLDITEVFNTIRFVSTDNEQLLFCMRDGGYEIRYNHQLVELKDGIITIHDEREININEILQ